MWSARADAAETAVRQRHLRRVWLLPGTVLGRSTWPADLGGRLHRHWNYWWQAHLLDCLVDAQLRDPRPERLVRIDRFVRSVRLRNRGGWTNDYYDDIAWLGLALQRVRSAGGRPVDEPIRVILARLREGWTPDAGGGIWWRRGDAFKNAPANGPAAIMHARAGERERAAELFRWMSETLVDPDTGLVLDGLRTDTGELVRAIYTYCQGVYLGTCLELSETGAAERTVRAVAGHCAPGGVLRGQGGGDGGLFAGILARYLAQAALTLSGPAASAARELVLTSARACWSTSLRGPGGPVFGADWSRPAPSLAVVDSDPARGLSVQVGSWMLLEAAARLTEAA
ncbi:glycoside hydrolase family 76 protein [Amycolatopsis antarctica]|uniref:glycoside hydrolase family 76 protein n=1 Tax=Amycolatopsis antarctica TaxID=1854586 RepID=UPI003B82E716